MRQYEITESPIDPEHRIAKIFTDLGVRKIRITGGEPLLRSKIDQLVSRIASITELEDIALTTNGLLLHRYAEKLAIAGLKRINVSLDALDRATLLAMNGSEINPETILANIALARQHGLLVQVNMVVIRGVNEEQIIPMARYFKEHNITLRFIEFMDVGNQNRWTASNVVTKQEIIKKLSAYFQLEAIE